MKVLRFVNSVAIILSICLCLVSCSNDKGVMSTQMLKMGYEIVENPVTRDNIDYYDVEDYVTYDSYDHFESSFFEKEIEDEKKSANNYIVVSGKKIKSTYYYKDMGTYKSSTLGSAAYQKDIRRIVLTEIEITEVWEQIVLKGKKYKRGDKLVVVEEVAFGKTSEELDMLKNKFMPIYDGSNTPGDGDDISVLYLTLPKNPVKFGSYDYGYDYLDNVWNVKIHVGEKIYHPLYRELCSSISARYLLG